MRIPPFERFMRFTQGVGLVLAGMVIGAAVYHSLFQAQFDRAANQIGRLEDQLNERDSDLSKLNQFKELHSVIKTVQIRFEDGGDADSLDEPTKSRLKALLHKDLLVLEGRSVYEIDRESRLARELLAGKVYRDKDKSFTLEIKTALVVDNKLQVWASIRRRGPELSSSGQPQG
ncbi:hypothetical protein HGI30_16480 [Paenibacillus albicereus]|uniref:Sporulation membrane protein YtrI C-terminal domain-containing protein n=1 Tax=Paenibacillus albicereus TaxID=2726185 RepID=A0A6H2H085_9BACL|nr:hypothetical protein [Paenibacillus albicereus]QJC53009.1 hypothetical protein HGI30_16480 [Paenibacillus albicereus]